MNQPQKVFSAISGTLLEDPEAGFVEDLRDRSVAAFATPGATAQGTPGH